ncbi:elongation factor G [Alkaliphilus transvaalensis]|uniref:elongation factor G n=1 Tax=Alkaliphilus transvaalensis TaxID=114628 RepID=UPI000687F9ED|nr:TetM/TetW/TetO/TetS family tetracycline resistance ribosomal protection protein [Alkaliphilus transvaalensis]
MGNLPIKNIGIFAHVDAGKTTIAENLLYLGGCIKRIGRVDKGMTQTDSLEIERKRGISVRLASVTFEWKSSVINIIDTPGHADFYAEVERSMRVLDGAVLVVSAVEGVQAQTKIIWDTLEKMKIPTIIFINKIDRLGVNIGKVLEEISNKLTSDILDMQMVTNEGMKNASTVDFIRFMDDDTISYSSRDNIKRFHEQLALYDEALFNQLVNNNEPNPTILDEKISDLCKNRRIFPLLYGSAINSIGVEFLMNTIGRYLGEGTGNPDSPFSAVIYKIEHDIIHGRLTFIRVFNGTVTEYDKVLNNRNHNEEKVIRIFKLKGTKMVRCESLRAGEIGVLCGVNAKIGDILGNPEGITKLETTVAPLLTVKIEAKEKHQNPQLINALKVLEEEEPLLYVKWHDDKKEINIQLMGMIQMEVITSILQDRFHLDVIFDEPSVLYQETPMNYAESFVAKDGYTDLGLSVEPIERGKGIQFESKVSTDYIFRKYQNEVKDTIYPALEKGLMGYRVNDVRVTIVAGKSTPIATLPSDFRHLTYAAIQEAIKAAGTILLEPILKFNLIVPVESSKQIFSTLINIKAVFDPPETLNGYIVFEGTVPVATSINFSTKLAGITGGKGVYTAEFYMYKECFR